MLRVPATVRLVLTACPPSVSSAPPDRLLSGASDLRQTVDVSPLLDPDGRRGVDEASAHTVAAIRKGLLADGFVVVEIPGLAPLTQQAYASSGVPTRSTRSTGINRKSVST